MKRMINKLKASQINAAAALLLFVEPVVHAADRVEYYHTDALGSVIASTDESGNVLWRESYRPFGDRMLKEVSTQDNTPFYTGKPHDDATDLSYFGARYYDPRLGRFLGVDSAGVDPANLHTFNRYAYANNNPYRYVDPDGMWAVSASRVFSLKNNRWERSYSIRFQKGGAVGAYTEAYMSRSVKAVKRLGQLSKAADKMIENMPKYVGHGDIGGKAELDARSADSKIESEFTKKWTYGTDYISQENINEALKKLWDSTPDDIKKLYPYKSYRDILLDANKHDFPHPSDPMRKQNIEAAPDS